MDLTRIQKELAEAQRTFSLVELRPTTDGKVFAKTGLQTVTGNYYVLSIRFPDTYPNEMPRVYIDAPSVTKAPHKYKPGNICYLHPTMWNPGLHDLKFVIGRAAKWLNKYEIWRTKGSWPGAELKH